MSQLGTGSEISVTVCDITIILEIYETGTMLLLRITKGVREKSTEKTNIVKKKYEKFPSVLKLGKNKKTFISQNQKIDITITPQVYDRAGCKIMFLYHENKVSSLFCLS